MNRARSAIAAVIVVAALGAALVAHSAAAEPPQLQATLLRSYDAFDANQAVAVDRSHFFAVDNTSITQHDRKSGAPLLQFAGAEGGPLIHMENYDESPMESSVQSFDARTLRHVGSHSFGIDRGSLTWLDHHDGSWWAGFASYDVVPDGQAAP